MKHILTTPILDERYLITTVADSENPEQVVIYIRNNETGGIVGGEQGITGTIRSTHYVFHNLKVEETVNRLIPNTYRVRTYVGSTNEQHN